MMTNYTQQGVELKKIWNAAKEANSKNKDSIERLKAIVERAEKKSEKAMLSGDMGQYVEAEKEKDFAQNRLQMIEKTDIKAYIDIEKAMNIYHEARNARSMDECSMIDQVLNDIDKILAKMNDIIAYEKGFVENVGRTAFEINHAYYNDIKSRQYLENALSSDECGRWIGNDQINNVILLYNKCVSMYNYFLSFSRSEKNDKRDFKKFL